MSTVDTAGPVPPDVEAAKPRGRRRLLVVAALAIVAVGAAAWLLLGADDGAADADTAFPVPAEGEVVEVATMTVNLAGPGTRYAKVGFAAVLVEGADPAVVTDRIPLLKDAALVELSRHSAAELTEPGGLQTLRAGLTERATALVPEGQLLRIVLTELVVQ